ATISGSYRAVIKNSHNCSNESDPVSVIFGVSPSVNITSDKVIPYCENDSIVLTANTSSTDIHWSQGTTTKEVTLKQSGTYKVVVNSVDGCTASDSLKVDFWPL